MIIVFGSVNMDVNLQVQAFPAPGETILSPTYDMTPGGKGANQALAAVRGGVKTALVGMIGDDGMGTRILNNIRRHEVMTSGVGTSDTLPTGMAFVMRDKKGENQIIVASGANAQVRADQVPDEILKPGNVVLFQMEISQAENLNVMERAKKHGATVILNLAPAIRLSQKTLDVVDYLIVNEIEARQIAGVLSINPDQDLVKIAQALSAQAHLDCIVTLGAQGAVAVTKDGKAWKVPALAIPEVVDTAGAGDCFCGTLAAALHEKKSMPEAMRRAVVAASLSCLKTGTQDSYPYSAEIEDALKTFPPAEAC